jgi:hypothetical protein
MVVEAGWMVLAGVTRGVVVVEIGREVGGFAIGAFIDADVAKRRVDAAGAGREVTRVVEANAEVARIAVVGFAVVVEGFVEGFAEGFAEVWVIIHEGESSSEGSEGSENDSHFMKS